MKVVNKQSKAFQVVLLFALFVISFIFFKGYINPSQIDFDTHVYTLIPLLQGAESSSLPLYEYITHVNYLGFHQICIFFDYLLPFSIETIVSFTLSLFVCLKMVIIMCIFRDNRVFITVVIFMICLIMPINFNVNNSAYLGSFVGTIWHNPTYIVMIPFSILTVYFFKKIFIDRVYSTKDLVTLGLIAFVSAYFKPSFLFGFIPASGLYLLIVSIKERSIKIFLRDTALCFVIFMPTVIFMFYQYFMIFESTLAKTSIVFDFLVFWKLYSNNIIISILAGNLLLLSTYFIGKLYKDKGINYFMALALSGLAIILCLTETGFRASHGNFVWTYASLAYVAAIFMIVHYFANQRVIEFNKKNIIISLVLLLHFISGMIYIYSSYYGIIQI